MTINCKGKLLDLKHPKIMGILNLTPDSFYDGGKFSDEAKILKKVESMILDGMDILDIGGQTTKPGSDLLSADEEMQRIMPIMHRLVKEFPDLLISIDTFYSKTATNAIESGAAIINDVSAGSIDDNMFTAVAELQVPYILMHMQGKPKNMQQKPTYENVVLEVNQFLSEKLFALHQLQINDIILDVGYGFGKTVEHNFQLLKNQRLIGFGNYPILTGISRKSIICKTLNIKPYDAINGTTALHILALQNGANILRVHDVKEVRECIKLFEMYQSVE